MIKSSVEVEKQFALTVVASKKAKNQPFHYKRSERKLPAHFARRGPASLVVVLYIDSFLTMPARSLTRFSRQ